MGTRAKWGTALFAVTVLVAGCGGSSTPDVSGGSASDSATLFKASNLNKVLADAKSKLGGTSVMVLKIEPRDVKIVGQNRTVTVDNSGKSVVVNTPSLPGSTFDLSMVSPGTVEKIVTSVESKANVKQTGIAYVAVAVDPINNKPFYGVYLVSGGSHYQANINGGGLRSFGGSGGASATPTTAPSGGTPAGGANSAQRIANCVSRAGTDPAKIKACTGG